MTTISIYSAKVTIKMMILSNYFGKNLWCTFTQILDEKIYKFLIFKIFKVDLQNSQLKRPRKKKYYKKVLQTLYGQKDHLPWYTVQEK